jgi:hypothetical protein
MKNQVNWLNCHVNILVPILCNRDITLCVYVICVSYILSLLISYSLGDDAAHRAV